MAERSGSGWLVGRVLPMLRLQVWFEFLIEIRRTGHGRSAGIQIFKVRDCPVPGKIDKTLKGFRAFSTLVYVNAVQITATRLHCQADSCQKNPTLREHSAARPQPNPKHEI
jgi:hypothetical protein